MRIYLALIILVPFYSGSQVFAPIRGVISNFENQLSNNEKIIFFGVKTNKKIVCISDEKGRFYAKLPDGDTYNISIESYQKELRYNTISIPKAPVGASFQEMILTIKFEHPQTFTLEAKEFETGSSTLKNKAKLNLNQFASFLKRKKASQFLLTGHTDDVGNAESNMKLSLERARSVKKYLVSKGCLESQLVCSGKGSSNPIASNATDQGRRKNRRTVIAQTQ
jgi:outer membrane protein OmpA-like peptidoglycan-associated protein